MTENQITTSVALFFDCKNNDPVPLVWFQRARDFLKEYDLAPILFSAAGKRFQLDDCYRLDYHETELVEELRSDYVIHLGLDAPRYSAEERSNWRSDISAGSIDGTFYAGIDQEIVADPVALLRRAYEIAQGVLPIRYGIAYKMPLSQDPACYAFGAVHSFAEVLDFIRNRRNRPPKTRDELWGDELMGERRHLGGFFRGAYPVNLLSETHVRKANLESHRIGRLSQFDESLWLWELSEAELPEAERILAQENVLV